jgi:predicted MFS family arabinose efflux permease
LIAGGALWAAGASFVEPATTAMAIDRAPAERRGAALATYTSAFQAGNAVGATGLGIVVASAGFAHASWLGVAITLLGLVVTGALATRRHAGGIEVAS